MLRAREVFADVFQDAGEVACRLALLIGYPDLFDVAGGKLTRQELGIVAIVLLALVGCRLVHLGHGADDAVDPKTSQGADKVESGHAGFVNRFRGIEG